MKRAELRLVGPPPEQPEVRSGRGRCLWCDETVYHDQPFIPIWSDFVVHEHCGPYRPRFGTTRAEQDSA